MNRASRKVAKALLLRGSHRRARVTGRVLTLTALLLAFSAAAARAEPVNVLVLKEHGVGMAAQAQPFVDRIIALAAKQNGWSDAKGRYVTTRKAAEAFIASEHPHYGILSLGAFLALRQPLGLVPVGSVTAVRAGGREYSIISKNAESLDACKGKTLASDHTDDPRFIEKMVARGAFTLSDFQIVPTQRPLQGIRKVVTGAAACALIDDAQLEELKHLDEGKGTKAVWTSAELPPLVVVAFPAAPAEERARFKDNLEKICAGEGKAACGEVGILSLREARDDEFADLVAAYEQ